MLSTFKTPFMEECPICLSPLNGSVTTVGCCKKQFHTGCIIKCAQHKNECPMCRVRDCIVYVPEPVQEQVSESKQRTKFFWFVTAGSFTFVCMFALKNYGYL
jgi:hypothetical protein